MPQDETVVFEALSPQQLREIAHLQVLVHQNLRKIPVTPGQIDVRGDVLFCGDLLESPTGWAHQTVCGGGGT